MPTLPERMTEVEEWVSALDKRMEEVEKQLLDKQDVISDAESIQRMLSRTFANTNKLIEDNRAIHSMLIAISNMVNPNK